MTFLQCAQKCAHSMVTISIPRIAEPIAAQGISDKAAVFQTVIIAKSPSPEEFEDPQVLAYRILTDAR